MTVPYILGIDPGLSGALAVVEIATGELVTVKRMPVSVVNKQNKLNGADLAAWLHGHADDEGRDVRFAYIEEVHSRPRQAGQFQFGLNTGILHGMLYAKFIPFTTVAPAKWKAHFGIKRVGEETKADKKSEARELAMQLFPHMAHEFKRVKDDGVAESALIALYGAHLQQQKESN